MLLLKCTTTKSQNLITSEYLLLKQDHLTEHLNLTCDHTFFGGKSNFGSAKKACQITGCSISCLSHLKLKSVDLYVHAAVRAHVPMQLTF